MTFNNSFATKYTSNSCNNIDDTSSNEQNINKQYILLRTLVNLIKTKSYSCISCIVDDLHTTLLPNFTNALFLIEVLQLLMTEKNKGPLMIKLINRNKQKILSDKFFMKQIQIIYSLCYFGSVIESHYFQVLQNKLYTSVLLFLDQVISSNDLTLDIDLTVFNSILTELAYLQSCFLKVKIMCDSFDKFKDDYQSDLKFDKEFTKNQIIDNLIFSCNAGYEILLIISGENSQKTCSTEGFSLFNQGDTRSSIASINNILKSKCYFSELDYLKIREKYSINEIDKFQVVDFILTCFKNFCRTELKWIHEIKGENDLCTLSKEIRYLFNEMYLDRKEYFINLYLDNIANDEKMEIKKFYFSFQYEMLLDEVQELLVTSYHREEDK